MGMFAALGVDPARMEFEPPSDYAEYLAAYRQVDIALDPFPFGGGVTTCDALWMGAPVVTCPGETFASRHCLSHLANVGLTETVARDLDEYVEIAAALAGDLPRLAANAGRACASGWPPRRCATASGSPRTSLESSGGVWRECGATPLAALTQITGQ